MIDHTENNLRAATKALSDVVMPALDPADPMAREQLSLVIAFLEFTRSRVYDIHARQRVELGHQLALAEMLVAPAGDVSALAQERLAADGAVARTALDDPASTTGELRDASRRLWATVRGVIREARDADAGVRSRIEGAVIDGSQPLLELQRAWYAPLGFDPDPSHAPLAELLESGR